MVPGRRRGVQLWGWAVSTRFACSGDGSLFLSLQTPQRGGRRCGRRGVGLRAPLAFATEVPVVEHLLTVGI